MENKEILIGSIDHYIYMSEDSLYKVALVITEDDEEVLIVGNFPVLEEGLNYEFVGIYKDHPKYGRQFSVSSYTKSKSFTQDGLIAYLSSDKFFSIGLKLATYIVETLGLDCIDKILKDENVLDDVPHMNKSRKEIISTVLKENYANEQVFIRLYGFGLTNTMVYRLYEIYGVSAANVVEENPYILIYEVEGFGFKKSDQLALRLGFKENDSVRLKEALRYTLNVVCYQQGYTFLTEAQLINSSLGLLQNNPIISYDDMRLSLEELVQMEKIIKEEDRYFDPILHRAEVRVSERIRKSKEYKFKPFSKEKIEEALKKVQVDLDITYTDLQCEAIINALSNKLSIITGGPGTGKSTIINGVLHCYAILNELVFPCDELDMKVVMMAPTGRAAKRMTEVTRFKASTIHKALGYNYEGGFAASEDAPLNYSLAIIDESSMIDISLAASLFAALPLSCQIIMVGDENQLPSVGPGNVFHDLIASNLFNTVKLFQIMRQAKDSNIIKLSNMVFNERIDYRILSEKKEVYYYPCDAKNMKDILFKLLDAYLKTDGDLQSGIQILIPMYAGVAGIDAINESVSNRYNDCDVKIVRDNQIIKKNDKVLQLKNDPELGIMNGDIGKVIEITKIKDKDYLLIDFDGKVVTYPTKELENLRLAYAISIHKSQGSEYDNVILPILPSYYMMLRKKIIYTAITRAKKKLILLGNIDTLNQAITTQEPIRQTALISRLTASKSSIIKILDSTIPFDTLGEYDMDGITPYSFME